MKSNLRGFVYLHIQQSPGVDTQPSYQGIKQAYAVAAESPTEILRSSRKLTCTIVAFIIPGTSREFVRCDVRGSELFNQTRVVQKDTSGREYWW